MPAFVLDASVTLAWCFQDEAAPWSDGLLLSLRTGDRAQVPAHWPVEVSSAFSSAFRRKRATLDEVRGFWDDIAQLPIEIEPPLTPIAAKGVLDLAIQYGLTPYDAVYLDLALRLSLPLASLDSALCKAASAAGVALL